MEFSHVPVLLDQCMEQLRVRSDGVYVDGTLGGGGHSCEICRRLGENGRLYGFDRDGDAIAAAGRRLEPWRDRFTAIHSNYADMKERLEDLGVDAVDGILLDLGVSSYQLDTADRGFSYRFDGPLDMRMDRRQPVTAKDIVNGYSEEELYRVLRDYGEERCARQIARQIVLARQKAPVETTFQLVEIIRRGIPAKARMQGGHPAKKTFQAIRIELNDELGGLRASLDDMIDLLKPGGRICVITFHSLEDRMVKTVFRRREHPCTCPPDFPVCVCGKKPDGRVVTRKPICPSEEETERNPRSKSAKLRVFEKGKD